MLVYFKEAEKVKDIINLRVHEIKDLQEEITTQKKQEEMNFISKSEEYGIKEGLKKQLEWEYPYKVACNIPTMTTVSKIKEEEMKNTLLNEVILEDIKGKTNKQEKKIPEFMKEEVSLTKARMGSLIHLCLQKLEEKEEYNLEKIENLIKSFVHKKFMTQKEAEAINPEDILNYTKSDLFTQLKQAKQVYKEIPFYFDMDAKEIVKQEVDEKILVQGIIDLYYIDKENHMVLVDYKTDFVKQEEELIAKYQKQLEIYKRAIEEATGKKVDQVYIYSIYLQKMIAL